MKLNTLILILLFTFCACSTPETDDLESIKELGLIELHDGMTRSRAEAIIAKARQQNSQYELWAMDLSSEVDYEFPTGERLVVYYRPGSPAARGIDGHGGREPIDGIVLSFEIIK